MEERDIKLLVAELGECHRLIDTMVKQTDRFQRLGTDLVSAFEQAKSVRTAQVADQISEDEEAFGGPDISWRNSCRN